MRDVGLHRGLGHDERLRDLLVGEPAGQEPQDLALAVGERREPVAVAHDGVGQPRGDLRQQPAGHGRGEDRVAGGHGLHGGDEVGGAGVLEQEAARARAQRVDDEVVQAERREDQDAVARQAARRLDAVHARHADVHEHDVGVEALGERDRLVAVAGLGDHGDPARRLEHGLEARAHERLVVGDEDAERCHGS
jgi:hypothetical protein